MEILKKRSDRPKFRYLIQFLTFERIYVIDLLTVNAERSILVANIRSDLSTGGN